MVGGINSSLQSGLATMQALYSSSPVSQVLPSEAAKPVATGRIEPAKTLDSQSARPIPFSESISNNRSISQSDSNANGDPAQQNVRNLDIDNMRQQQQVQNVINQLKARDAEVRAHEMAHMAAAGGYARGMSFTYQTGPDGKQYAIGGEVGIDTAPIAGDPEATLQKAMVIQRAALAPAEPSAQDQKVAQAASQMMTQARVDIAIERQEQQELQNGEQEAGVMNDSVVSEQAAESSNSQAETAELNGNQNVIAERQQFDLRLQVPLAQNLLG